MNELRTIVSRLTTDGAPLGCVLATLVTVAGSSYRRPGARLLLAPEIGRIGSISGGCLEEDVLVRARRVAETGSPELVTYDTTSENDLVWGVGLGCHGVIRLLLERIAAAPRWAKVLAENQRSHRPTRLAVVWQADDPARLGTCLADELPPANGAEIFFDEVPPPVPLVIFGAGDDAQPLARFAHALGWRVTVADPRPEFASPARFPTATEVIVAPAGELVARAAPPPEAAAVIMTHRYVSDVPVLRELLSRPLAYLGLLGPKQRAERLLADLASGGLAITAEQRARLHAPVGLDLGADTPEEIALSILAEIRATLAGRAARPLRERTAPIHG